MTQEDKELLLRDLCARLPYHTFVSLYKKEKCVLCGIDGDEAYLNIDSDPFAIENIRPYLRPMSSMTDEEKKIQKEYIYHFSGNNLPHYEGDFVFEDEVHEYIDWLNAHHFDYRGLIEKNLAIAVIEENNPYK